MRLSLPVDQLQMTFDPEDQSLLNLAAPQFKFNIEARHVFGLGDVSWVVTVVTDSGKQKAIVSATARAWENQLTLVRPLATREVIQATDLVQPRAGGSAAERVRCLTSGRSRSGRRPWPASFGPANCSHGRTWSRAVPLAKVGQLITVALQQGTIHIKTIARAMEGGSYGQSIKAKNEATGDVYEVTLTGPQEGTIGGAAAPPAGATHVASTN